MISTALRPLMSALRLRSGRRRLNRRELMRLLADTHRRPNLRRLGRLSAQPTLTR